MRADTRGTQCSYRCLVPGTTPAVDRLRSEIRRVHDRGSGPDGRL